MGVAGEQRARGGYGRDGETGAAASDAESAVGLRAPAKFGISPHQTHESNIRSFTRSVTHAHALLPYTANNRYNTVMDFNLHDLHEES